jgi:hypothetical protein
VSAPSVTPLHPRFQFAQSVLRFSVRSSARLPARSLLFLSGTRFVFMVLLYPMRLGYASTFFIYFSGVISEGDGSPTKRLSQPHPMRRLSYPLALRDQRRLCSALLRNALRLGGVITVRYSTVGRISDCELPAPLHDGVCHEVSACLPVDVWQVDGRRASLVRLKVQPHSIPAALDFQFRLFEHCFCHCDFLVDSPPNHALHVTGDSPLRLVLFSSIMGGLSPVRELVVRRIHRCLLHSEQNTLYC